MSFEEYLLKDVDRLCGKLFSKYLEASLNSTRQILDCEIYSQSCNYTTDELDRVLYEYVRAFELHTRVRTLLLYPWFLILTLCPMLIGLELWVSLVVLGVSTLILLYIEHRRNVIVSILYKIYNDYKKEIHKEM